MSESLRCFLPLNDFHDLLELDDHSANCSPLSKAKRGRDEGELYARGGQVPWCPPVNIGGRWGSVFVTICQRPPLDRCGNALEAAEHLSPRAPAPTDLHRTPRWSLDAADLHWNVGSSSLNLAGRGLLLNHIFSLVLATNICLSLYLDP